MRLRKKILQFKSDFLAHVGVLIAGSALAQGIVFASSPLIARLYAPDAVGKFGLFLGFIGLANNIGSLRFEQAIPIPRTKKDATTLFYISSFFCFPVSLVLTICWFTWNQNHESTQLLPFFLIGLSFFLAAQLGPLRLMALRLAHFKAISKVTGLQGIGRAIIPLPLGTTNIGWMGFWVGEFFGRFLSAIFFYRTIKNDLPLPLSKIFFFRAWNLVKTYRHFPLFGFPSTLLDTLGSILPNFFIARHYGLDAAGYYTMAQRLTSVPLALLSVSIGEVFFSKLAEKKRNSEAKAIEFFEKTCQFLFISGLAIVAIIGFLAPPLATLVLGIRWEKATEIIISMLPVCFSQYFISPLTRAIPVYGGQKPKFIYDTTTLLLVIAIFYVGRKSHLPIIPLLWMLHSVITFSYLLYFLILWKMVHHNKAEKLMAPSHPNNLKSRA